MIRTKAELKFYIMADRMMRTGSFKCSIKEMVKSLLTPDYIWNYIKTSRKATYYSRGLGVYYRIKRNRLGIKCGLSIAFDDIGYGIVIPHYGTIVVGNGNKIGNYAVLHTSTCITQGNREIGNGFYLSCGAKVVRDITIGDNVSVGANSLVNHSFESDCMIAGAPAHFIKECDAWYIRDGAEYTRRVSECEKLKEKMFI